MSDQDLKKRARESRAAIEKIYITMRHLFNRGDYKPNGISGSSLKQALLQLSPEIYGTINSPERVELDGLLYVIDRLPRGIEECRFIKLIAREGYEHSGFETLIPPKRRRNCYRIDEASMYIEMTRGRSDIYDILTHLTFLYVEAEKIKNHALDSKRRFTNDWHKLEEIVNLEHSKKSFDRKQAITYLSNVLGRTFEETREAATKFETNANGNSLFHVTYWLGLRAIEEEVEQKDCEITFSAQLRDHIGHHIYGDRWAYSIKQFLHREGMLHRPVHIISANLHSVMNACYGMEALADMGFANIHDLALETSKPENGRLRDRIKQFAHKYGLRDLPDTSGTNLGVQVIDVARMPNRSADAQLPVIIVMDYAFGEQAFECMDELLKPLDLEEGAVSLRVESIAIMGKAGILEGGKGDIMIPTAHVFEGTADNYPFDNALRGAHFEGHGLGVYEGPMITVLGTSLQNKNVLEHFRTSTWNAIGIEMEGAHYQKAIQSASKIRKSIPDHVTVMYAYYASDNPLESGKTLASGSLGAEGVKPTYLITERILERILG
jgi:hypothetical protein